MNEEINPGPAPDRSSGNAADALAGALDELIQNRLSDAVSRPAEPMAPESTPPEGPSQPCPDPGEWALLLATRPRLADQARVEALLAHAAGCKVCAGRLRDLQADVSPDESALLAGLASASPLGQRKLAAQLARTPRSSSVKRPTQRYLWTGAGLAASLLIALGLVSWWRAANDPERLLAESYTHARIFDLRMPGAGFAPVTPVLHLRGGSVSHEPAKLLEARARLAQRLAAAPEDAHLLQLEARSEVLDEKFDQAIGVLDHLVATGPVTASLLLDDGSAYFQRGTATGSEADRTTALDYLRRADEMAPGDPVVLFNEAIAMEDRGQFMNAVETWNRYLRFERDARWQAEGRRRLQSLEEQLNQLKTHQSGAE